MASELPRQILLANFRPSKSERSKAKRTKPDPREDREGNDEKHLKAIRLCPCCVPGCNVVGVDPHHLKCIPGTRGVALRAPDQYAVPLCRTHHDEIEKIGSRNERSWFARIGIDPENLADALWRSPRGNGAAYTRIVLAHKQGSK